MKLKELIGKIVMILCLVGLFEVGINTKVYAAEEKIVNFTSFGTWVEYKGDEKIIYKVVPKKSGVYNVALDCGFGPDPSYYSTYGTLYNSDKKYIGTIVDRNDVDEAGNEFYLSKGKTYYVVLERSNYAGRTGIEGFGGEIKISYLKDVKLEEYTDVTVEVQGYDISNGHRRFEGISYNPKKHVLELNNYTGEGDISISSPYDFEVDEKDDPNFLNFTIKITGNNTIDSNPGLDSIFNICGHGNFNVIGDGTVNCKFNLKDTWRNKFIDGHGCNIIFDGPTIITDKINSALIVTCDTNNMIGKFTFKSGSIIINNFVNSNEFLLSAFEAGAMDMSGGFIRINYVVNGSLEHEKTHGMFCITGEMNVTGGNIIITGDAKTIPKVKVLDSFAKMNEKTKNAILIGARIKIQDVKMKLEKYSYKFDGNAKTPKVIVNGLEEGKDYIVSYVDNVNVGVAKVIVKGRGHFWGSKTFRFKISGEENIKVGDMETYDGIHGLKLGSTFTDGKLIYKVTKEGTLDGKTVGKVTVVGLKKKSLKKVSIKSVLIYEGVKYKVTAIGKKAFKKGKKLKSIVIGKNVSKISNGAFAGCKKLKSIKIKSKKIKKFVKGTFKGVKKTCVIKVPKAKKKVYTKKIKKSGFKGIIK
ncbi:leucine-rich repeat protein [Eubacterium sp.]|uniref:leucine-rich repeat protein n=1 Tax=Eubacterium sp. TaxID=142586 RepID=UPI0025DCE0BB|nr:leucine-rich repeat protein [Eubacterium sp.]MCR5628152.1 leucine-rich repeat protein [Eubacterium sp.]